MLITKDQLDPKKPPRRIGRSKGVPVFEVVTLGGLNLIIAKNDGTGTKILGAAPHRALARYIAQQKDPDFMIEELSKSEDNEMAEAGRVGKHLIEYFSNLADSMSLKF